MRWFLPLALISWVALGQPVALPKLSGPEVQQLERGATVVRDTRPTDGKGIGCESMAVVDAPVALVWPVLRDCQHFAEFMPRMKASSLKEEGGAHLCHVELRLPFPLMNLWSDTKSVQREEPVGHFHRAWTLVRGTYRRNSGSWTVVPWGPEGTKTLVVYAIDSDPMMLVPDSILRSAQMHSLPEVFEAIRNRVVALRR